MMARKKRGPYEHSGKLITHRTAKQIESEVATSIERLRSGIPPVTVTLDFYRDAIEWIYAAEQVLFESAGEAGRQTFDDRTSPLRECRAWIQLIEKQCGEPLSENDARALAYNAMRIGWLISRCEFRLIEASAVDGMDQYHRGKVLAESKLEQAFSVTRDELLSAMKAAYIKHGKPNQKDLCDYVATALGGEIGGVQLRKKFLQGYKITKAEYAAK